MECSLHCSLAMADGSRKETIDANAVLLDDSLKLFGSAGREEDLDLRDIIGIEAIDRSIRLTMCDGRDFDLDVPSARREELLGAVCRAKNALTLGDLPPAGPPRIRGVMGEIRSRCSTGAPGPLDRCELRVYRDSIVIIPSKGSMLRFPISGMTSVAVEKYGLAMRFDDGGSVMVSRLGRELEPARRAVADTLADARLRSLALLRGLLPNANPPDLEFWAKATSDGTMVRLIDLEKGLPGIRTGIEGRLESAGLGEMCAHLFSMGWGDKAMVGMRRTVKGAAITEDFWALVPVISSGEDGGNAIAFVGTDEPSEAGATLFFRIVPRETFRANGDTASESEVEQAMDRTARALRSIDFMRPPFMLTDQKLASPENARHRHILNLVSGLRETRERFIGKVAHSSPERWTEMAGELLRFNVSAVHDDDVFAEPTRN